MADKREILLSVRDLKVCFGPKSRPFYAVNGVNFDVLRGETFGLVGESGSGKTTIGRALVRIHPASAGEIIFNGRRISGQIDKELDRLVTRKIQMVFQDPMASLNERAKVSYIVAEGLANTQKKISGLEKSEAVSKALSDVGLLPEFASRFPHEFSGGQRQRIGIARALIMEPEFIVADEPISALDVSIRAQVLNLLTRLKRERNLTYLLISHDLSVMRFISDRIAVIYKGVLVELANTERLFEMPLHPYTRALLSAIPLVDPAQERKKVLTVYHPEEHRYDVLPPKWREIEPGHFVLANALERDAYEDMLEKERARERLRDRREDMV